MRSRCWLCQVHGGLALVQVGICADGGSPSLVVWSLITASVWWSAAVAASCLAVDPRHRMFAIAVPPEPVRRWAGGATPRPVDGPAAPESPQPMLMNGSAAAADAGSAASPVSPHAAGRQMNGHRDAANVGSAHMNGAAAGAGSSATSGSAGAQNGHRDEMAQRGEHESAGQLEASVACSGGAFWYEEADSGGDRRAVTAGPTGGAAEAPSVRGSLVYGGGGGSVLLFEAGHPTPKQAWLLPR